MATALSCESKAIKKLTDRDILELFSAGKYKAITRILNAPDVLGLREKTFEQIEKEALKLPENISRKQIIDAVQKQKGQRSNKRVGRNAGKLWLLKGLVALFACSTALLTSSSMIFDGADVVTGKTDGSEIENNEIAPIPEPTDSMIIGDKVCKIADLPIETPNEYSNQFELQGIELQEFGKEEEVREALNMVREQEVPSVIGELNVATSLQLTEEYTSVREELQTIAEQAEEVLEPWRAEVVETARSIIGLPYFWGGKPSQVGWDPTWNEPRTVHSPGSSSTGTVRPFGMDCSGFTKWAYGTVVGDMDAPAVESFGLNTTQQRANNTRIDIEDVQPGDLAFNGRYSHVGIVTGWNEEGEMMVIHAAGSQNGVVETGLHYYQNTFNAEQTFTNFYRPHDALIKELESAMELRMVELTGIPDRRAQAPDLGNITRY
jgi:cell wall-associated NlpC family hydrolase